MKDREAWYAAVHGVAKSRTAARQNHSALFLKEIYPLLFPSAGNMFLRRYSEAFITDSTVMCWLWSISLEDLNNMNLFSRSLGAENPISWCQWGQCPLRALSVGCRRCSVRSGVSCSSYQGSSLSRRGPHSCDLC